MRGRWGWHAAGVVVGALGALGATAARSGLAARAGDEVAPIATEGVVSSPSPSGSAPEAQAPLAPASAQAPGNASAGGLAGASSAEADRAPRPAGDDPHLPVLVTFAGDCTLGSDYRVVQAEGSFHRAMASIERDFASVLKGMEPVLAHDDLTVVNLETTLTTTARPQSKGTFVFTGEPAFAAILSLGGVDLANVANNHALDFGTKGAEETVQAVEAAGMRAFGDRLVDVRTIRGLELVNLGYVGGATDTEPRVRADVAKHKRDGNVVLVSFHWGAEGVHVPNDEQVRVGRAAIDAGADVVIGHHPHVIQGIDDYKGRKIVYSLGNFVFGGNGHPADTDAVLFQQAFAKGPDGKAGPVANTARVVPVKLGGPAEAFRPTLLQGAEKDRVLARVDEYSRALRRPGK